MSCDELCVLVVDDSELQLQYEQELLSDERFRFVVAYNGLEALQAAKENSPDIVLLDIEMPVMDGISTVQCMRSDPSTAQIPVIMVTSRNEADYMENSFVGGCNDYVTKPVNKEELLMKIQSLTGYVASNESYE